MDEFLHAIYSKILTEISNDWKEKSDAAYKIIKKALKVSTKRLDRQIDVTNLERDKYNQLVHAFNVERTQLNIMILKLQSKIEKLKEDKEDG